MAQLVYWSCSPAFFFFNSTLDINVHDTYIVISQLHIATAIAFFFLLISLIYFTCIKYERPVSKGLSAAHYAITLVTLLMLVLPPLPLFASTRYFVTSDPFHSGFDSADYLAMAVIGFTFAQLLFLVNLVRALVKRTDGK